jgi:ribosomal subunit interface protein
MMIKNVSNGVDGRRTIARTLRSDPKQNGMLEIMIRTNGVELTEKLRDAVTRKIGRARQYAPRAFRARVHLEREHIKPTRDRFRVSVRYEIPGWDILAEHQAHEPFAALDLVSEKIERRLRKKKTARLASRVGRKARACRIADFCSVHEPYPERS